MKITAPLLAAIAGGIPTSKQRANAAAIIAGLDAYGPQAGLDRASRLLHFLPQVAHESGRFVYDKEVWDGKGAQAKYDTRTDLGNTPARDGDGKLFLGRTAMQLTGRANYAAFRDWCHTHGLACPDIVANPDLVNTDPWEGLVPIWYWSTKGLNRFADANDIEMVTRRINGGTNGLDDRIALFVRTGLVLLGRSGTLKEFQAEVGLTPDGVAGPKTRQALFDAVARLDDVAAPQARQALLNAVANIGAAPLALPAPVIITPIAPEPVAAAPIEAPPAPVADIASAPSLPSVLLRPDLIGRPEKVVEAILSDEGSRTIRQANAVIKKAVVNRLAAGGPAAFIVWVLAFLGGIPTWVWIVGALSLVALGVVFFLSWRQAHEAKAIKTARVDDALTGNFSYGGPPQAAG